MHLYQFLFPLIFSFQVQDCPQIEAIMVDACGTESLNEFVIISTGEEGFFVDNLKFGFNPTNTSGTSNLNINDGFISCGLTLGNPDVYLGCANIIAVGPGDFIPSDAYLVLQTSSGSDALYDFSDLCEEDACIYVVANSCTRTIGAFTNKNTNSPGLRNNTIEINGSTCSETITFNTQNLISNADGNYFIPPNTYGVASPNPCVAPPIEPAQGTIPIFDEFGPICAGSDSPLPLESNNGITGEWVPVFNNQETTSYNFLTDEDICGGNIEITIEVVPNDLPLFSFETNFCLSAETFFDLPIISDNSIQGLWIPAEIQPSTTTYTFVPTLDCSEEVSIEVTFEDAQVPEFSFPLEFCQGENFELPTISDNNITGEWNQAFNTNGSADYIFTPNSNQCAEEVSVFIEILSGDIEGIANDIPEDLELECGTNLPQPPSFNAEDFCGIGFIAFTEIVDAAECPSTQITTRTWEVLDSQGNEIDSFSQTITLVDNTPPFFTSLPNDVVLSCDDEWVEDSNVEAADDCSEVSIIVVEDIIDSDDCPQNFSIIRTFIALDACGNESSVQQNIQFIDSTPPIFDEDFPNEINVSCGEIPAVQEPSVFDTCSETVEIKFTENTTESCEDGKITERIWEATDECGNSSFFTQIIIEDCKPTVYSGISPNGDGINDVLEIENIECFPTNSFKVFNRYGRMVFSVDNYNNNDRIFSGLNQSGKSLVTGTYFYVFNFTNPRSNQSNTSKGWIYINNQT